MKISPITKDCIKKTGCRAFWLGTVVLGCYLMNKINNIAAEKEVVAKKVVKQYNPSLYQKMCKEDAGLIPWQKAAESIQDSLKIDSIARTNYALGMQAVRDSLANANK